MRKKNTLEKKQKEALTRFEDQLKKLYKGGTDSSTGIGGLDIRKSSWLKRIVLIEVSLFFLLVIGVVIFFVWDHNRQAGHSSIEARFELPRNISSGEVATFVLYYKNTERFTLYDPELVVRYPDNFEFISAEPAPTNTFHDIWKLGSLLRGEQGMVKIQGKVLGEVGSAVLFKADFTYQPQNFNSTFSESFASPTGQITSAVADITIDGPAQVIPDQNVTYAIHYVNTSESDLNRVRLEFQYPENFIILGTVPAPAQDVVKGPNPSTPSDHLSTLWSFDTFLAHATGTITVQGRFNATDNKSQKLIARIGQTEAGKEEVAYVQEHVQGVELIGQSLKIDIVNNGSKDDQSVNFGDTLNYSITYKNLGASTLYNVSMRALFQSEVIDWDTLIDKNGGTRQDDSLFWTATTVPALAIIKPLDEGTIDFSLKLKNLSAVNLQKDVLETQTHAQATIAKVDDLDTNLILESDSVKANINTKLDMQVQGRYFDDDNLAVGQGPLPPVVGKTTTFRIYWKLSNNLHEVSDVVIKTKLAPEAQWEDKFLSTLGTLTYNPIDSTVTWKINRIAPNQSFDDLNTWFDVSITPKSDEVGKLILLTVETSLSGKDNITQSGITQLSGAITSNLEDDPIGGGRGLVVGSE